jgi:catechol 2,3-dioxygenase-like lactoylglutathione lyase family enzyme
MQGAATSRRAGFRSVRDAARVLRIRQARLGPTDIAMIHHVSLGTNDLDRARVFYDAVLPVLGLKRLGAGGRSLDYGPGEIIFSVEPPADGLPASAGHGAHVAFAAQSRDAVDAFYRLALAHGGSDDGAPGLRPESHPSYYGAFVLDPDGNKVEAVTLSGR